MSSGGSHHQRYRARAEQLRALRRYEEALRISKEESASLFTRLKTLVLGPRRKRR